MILDSAETKVVLSKLPRFPSVLRDEIFIQPLVLAVLGAFVVLCSLSLMGWQKGNRSLGVERTTWNQRVRWDRQNIWNSSQERSQYEEPFSVFFTNVLESSIISLKIVRNYHFIISMRHFLFHETPADSFPAGVVMIKKWRLVSPKLLISELHPPVIPLYDWAATIHRIQLTYYQDERSL